MDHFEGETSVFIFFFLYIVVHIPFTPLLLFYVICRPKCDISSDYMTLVILSTFPPHSFLFLSSRFLSALPSSLLSPFPFFPSLLSYTLFPFTSFLLLPPYNSVKLLVPSASPPLSPFPLSYLSHHAEFAFSTPTYFITFLQADLARVELMTELAAARCRAIT